MMCFDQTRSESLSDWMVFGRLTVLCCFLKDSVYNPLRMMIVSVSRKEF